MAPALPGTPTLHEQGVQGLDVDAWYALYGPQGMPADLVKENNEALLAALAEPEVRSTLAKQGFDTRPGTPESLARISLTERDKWGALIKSLNLPME